MGQASIPLDIITCMVEEFWKEFIVTTHALHIILWYIYTTLRGRINLTSKGFKVCYIHKYSCLDQSFGYLDQSFVSKSGAKGNWKSLSRAISRYSPVYCPEIPFDFDKYLYKSLKNSLKMLSSIVIIIFYKPIYI